MRTSPQATKGFTLAEVMVSTAIAILMFAGISSSMLLFARTSLRTVDYNNMENQTTKALELLARDVRMAQWVDTNATGTVPNRVITSITLRVPDATTSSTTNVTYKFSGTNFVRSIAGLPDTILVRDIVSGSGGFSAYNLSAADATNDYETNQIKVIMTMQPDTHGNYVKATKRVLSARFVLRNH